MTSTDGAIAECGRNLAAPERPCDRLLGARPAVWAVKHVVSPLDRALYRLTGGRFLLGGSARDAVLLMTFGHRSGLPRTIPVFVLSDGDRLVVCNVRPAAERPNPWPPNLRADRRCLVQRGSSRRRFLAREATTEEIERWWPPLVRLWPPYGTHFRATGERSVFILEPADLGHPPQAPYRA